VTGDFDGRVVLVTGSSRGIGRHLAEHFLGRGATVVGVSRGAGTIEHPRYHHRQADLAVEAEAITAVRAAHRVADRLDVAVNNAGAAAMNHVLLTPGRTAEALMTVNYLATFVVSREAAKYMQRRRYGRIVNLSSVAVPLRLEGEAAYAAAKSAIATFSAIFAREVAPWGITCNVVAPGPVETDLIRQVAHEKIQAVIDRLAPRRLSLPEDVAYAVEMLCRPEAAAITGQVLYLGGVG
jgi:3-oxoacyl-[acyl-carrier protein] reductase